MATLIYPEQTGHIAPYPTRVLSWLLRLPLLFYRLGLGWLMNSSRIMVLTTRGRKSGLARHTAVEYRCHGSKVFVISGWGTRPQWFKNLLADPHVTLQLGGQTFAATARVVDQPGEASRVLHLFRRRAPFVYDPMLARMSREPTYKLRKLPDLADRFTIVRFDRQNEALPLDPVEADLAWLPLVGVLVSAVTLALLVMTRVRRTG